MTDENEKWHKNQQAIDSLVAEGKAFRIEGDPVNRDDDSFAVVLSGDINKLPVLGVLVELKDEEVLEATNAD